MKRVLLCVVLVACTKGEARKTTPAPPESTPVETKPAPAPVPATTTIVDTPPAAERETPPAEPETAKKAEPVIDDEGFEHLKKATADKEGAIAPRPKVKKKKSAKAK